MKNIQLCQINTQCLFLYKFCNPLREGIVKNKCSPAYRVFFLESGVFEVKVGENTYMLEGGDAFFMPPDTIYSTNSFYKEITLYSITFSVIGEQKWDKVNFTDCDICNDVKCFKRARVFQEIEKIYHNFYSQGVCGKIVANATLTLVLSKLIEGSVYQKNKLYQKILDYIEDNVYKDITCISIAQRFHYHPNYLNKVVKEGTGKGLNACILEAKCKMGAKLLLESEKSVTEIAGELFFFDGSHFSNVFKKLYGCSPIAFRKINGF